jgi:hypothetical protein
VTEHTYKLLFAWLEQHRRTLIEHAGGVAEMSEWASRAPRGAERVILTRIGRRCERFAVELGIALEALDRLRPEDDEVTQPGVLPPL